MEVFTDPSFQLIVDGAMGDDGQPLKKRRLFDVYEREIDIFGPEFTPNTFIEYSRDYPSFITEFNLIDLEYLKTFFITHRLTRSGKIEYMIRRDGEYFMEVMDDEVPVQSAKGIPPWGLRFEVPWQIVVMKAWLKEKGSIEALRRAQPPDFTNAFGAPGYRVIRLKKDIGFINNQRINYTEDGKSRLEERLRLADSNFIRVGKTRRDPKINDLGLLRDRLGYKLTSYDENMRVVSMISNTGLQTLEQVIFKVNSCVPSHWIGSLSVVRRGRINQEYSEPKYLMNIESEFLVTYAELVEIFSKIYITQSFRFICPEHMIEDTFCIRNPQNRNFTIFVMEVDRQGFANINIVLPTSCLLEKGEGRYRYPPIRYFLSRMDGNINNLPPLLRYKCHDIEYVKAYNKSCNRFVALEPGVYYLYVELEIMEGEMPSQVVVNYLSGAGIRRFEPVQLPREQLGEIFNATIYDWASIFGSRGIPHRQRKNNFAYIGNTFDEIGFGFVAINNLPQSPTEFVMKIYPDRFMSHQIRICPHGNYEQYAGVERSELRSVGGSHIDMRSDSWLLPAKPGFQQIVVFERDHRRNTQRERFPPQGCCEFYDIQVQ